MEMTSNIIPIIFLLITFAAVAPDLLTLDDGTPRLVDYPNGRKWLRRVFFISETLFCLWWLVTFILSIENEAFTPKLTPDEQQRNILISGGALVAGIVAAFLAPVFLWKKNTSREPFNTKNPPAHRDVFYETCAGILLILVALDYLLVASAKIKPSTILPLVPFIPLLFGILDFINPEHGPQAVFVIILVALAFAAAGIFIIRNAYRLSRPIPLVHFAKDFAVRLTSGIPVLIHLYFELPRKWLTQNTEDRVNTAVTQAILFFFMKQATLPDPATIISLAEKAIADIVNELKIPVFRVIITKLLQLEPDKPAPSTGSPIGGIQRDY